MKVLALFLTGICISSNCLASRVIPVKSDSKAYKFETNANSVDSDNKESISDAYDYRTGMVQLNDGVFDYSYDPNKLFLNPIGESSFLSHSWNVGGWGAWSPGGRPGGFGGRPSRPPQRNVYPSQILGDPTQYDLRRLSLKSSDPKSGFLFRRFSGRILGYNPEFEYTISVVQNYSIRSGSDSRDLDEVNFRLIISCDQNIAIDDQFNSHRSNEWEFDQQIGVVYELQESECSATNFNGEFEVELDVQAAELNLELMTVVITEFQ
ncbi:MAG: hypothetical protein HRU19_23800 [Pseudobacteriovorax sp.]|nr:hypothetical protein [Pseudobacteriovorax sp.]